MGKMKLKVAQKGIWIDNYRVLEKEYFFNLKPISILTGPNNSGKSSIPKLFDLLNRSAKFYGKHYAPLMLKNSLSSTELNKLSNNLNDPKRPLTIRFSSISDGVMNDFSYAIGYEVNSHKDLELTRYEINYRGDFLLKIENSRNSKGYFHLSNFNVNLGLLHEISKLILEEIDNRNKSLWELGFPVDRHLEEINNAEGFEFFKAENKENQKDINSYIQRLSNSKTNFRTLLQKLPDHDFLEKNTLWEFDFYANATKRGLKGFFKYLLFGIQQILESLAQDASFGIKKTVYLTKIIELVSQKLEEDSRNSLIKRTGYKKIPTRKNNNERYYNLRDNSEMILGLSLQEYWNKCQAGSSNHDFLVEGNPLPITSYVNLWINRFGIGKELIVKPLDGEDTIFEVLVTLDNGDKRNINDLGFGVSQILSLILLPLIYKNHENFQNMQYYGDPVEEYSTLQGNIDLIYLEEPEANLHPNWQSLLMELLVSQTKLGMHFLIETHSEYMIRYLQNEVGENKLDANELSILYFRSEQDYFSDTDLEKERFYYIGVEKNGLLSRSFGAGFLDEGGKLSLKLFGLNSPGKN